MKKVNLNELIIKNNFSELSEKCMITVDGGCGCAGGYIFRRGFISPSFSVTPSWYE